MTAQNNTSQTANEQAAMLAVAGERTAARYSKIAAKDPKLLSLRVRSGADAAREAGACTGPVS